MLKRLQRFFSVVYESDHTSSVLPDSTATRSTFDAQSECLSVEWLSIIAQTFTMIIFIIITSFRAAPVL
jgi:hypothetical protein